MTFTYLKYTLDKFIRVEVWRDVTFLEALSNTSSNFWQSVEADAITLEEFREIIRLHNWGVALIPFPQSQPSHH